MYGFLIKCKDELQLLFEGKKNYVSFERVTSHCSNFDKIWLE